MSAEKGACDQREKGTISWSVGARSTLVPVRNVKTGGGEEAKTGKGSDERRRMGREKKSGKWKGYHGRLKDKETPAKRVESESVRKRGDVASRTSVKDKEKEGRKRKRVNNAPRPSEKTNQFGHHTN